LVAEIRGERGDIRSEDRPYGSRSIYEQVVETIRDYAIFALDAQGRIATWNAGARRLKGYTADEIIGRHFSIFYPAADVAAGKPAYELVVAESEGRIEDEGWRLRKDGSRFWANVVITALTDDSGAVTGFAKVTRDLTERRLTDQALRESEERFRLLVDGVHDHGIFLLDPAGRVVSWNGGAERQSGYTANEVLGRHFSVFYPSADRASGKPARELRAAEEIGYVEEEGWRLRKDGSRFWASVVLTALRRPDGSLFGFGKVTRDLTERRAAEERALMDARQLAEAEAASRAKTDFLAAMSHELRTPLNAIAGYVDVLSLGIRGPLTQEQADDLERIRRSQRHLLGIVNDLINFSRIEAGRITYHIRPVAIGTVLDAVRAMVEPRAATKGIELEWPPAETLQGMSILADEAKAEQILVNVVGNAVKFTGREGRIVVTCARDDGTVRIAVTDTGIGIPPDRVERIFEPFVQIGRSLSSPLEGSGLGLAISRDLTRAMGGSLTVHSEVGAGSTFTLVLPAAPASSST
jgi:hypothetical protein